jgi:hypothetical protein
MVDLELYLQQQRKVGWVGDAVMLVLVKKFLVKKEVFDGALP